MMRTVLILAAAAVALLAVLALTRGGPRHDVVEIAQPKAPAAEQAAEPASAIAPAPKAEEPTAPPPEPRDPQVEEDAAAVGLTTREPAAKPEERTRAEAAQPKKD